jgi:hypothetical protein
VLKVTRNDFFTPDTIHSRPTQLSPSLTDRSGPHKSGSFSSSRCIQGREDRSLRWPATGSSLGAPPPPTYSCSSSAAAGYSCCCMPCCRYSSRAPPRARHPPPRACTSSSPCRSPARPRNSTPAATRRRCPYPLKDIF